MMTNLLNVNHVMLNVVLVNLVLTDVLVVPVLEKTPQHVTVQLVIVTKVKKIGHVKHPIILVLNVEEKLLIVNHVQLILSEN